MGSEDRIVAAENRVIEAAENAESALLHVLTTYEYNLPQGTLNALQWLHSTVVNLGEARKPLVISASEHNTLDIAGTDGSYGFDENGDEWWTDWRGDKHFKYCAVCLKEIRPHVHVWVNYKNIMAHYDCFKLVKKA